MSIKYCSQCGNQLNQNINFCSKCGKKLTHLKDRENGSSQYIQKKAQVVSPDRGRYHFDRRDLYILLPFLVFGLLLYFVFQNMNSKSLSLEGVNSGYNSENSSQTQQPMMDIDVSNKNGMIIIPLNIVKEKKLVAFQYTNGATRIPLLAYISPKGKVVTAVSMCEPCKSERFHSDNNRMICDSCGTSWDLENLSGISGSCQTYPPDVLSNTVVGNDIQIKESLVANWKKRA